MVHNIFGERFIGRREPAWHGLGTVFPEDRKLSPSMALILGGCNYFVTKQPLFAALSDGTNLATNSVALVRTPTQDDPEHRVFGVATDDYEIVQNLELTDWLESIGEQWPVETIGALGYGEQLFVTLGLGKTQITNDDREEVRNYLLVTNNHDGKGSLTIAIVRVRTVCENTLIAGLSSALLTTKIPHKSNIKAEAQLRLRIISEVRRAQERSLEDFRLLARTRVVDEQINEILRAAYPDPVAPKKQIMNEFIANDPKLISEIGDSSEIARELKTQLLTFGEAFEARKARTMALRDKAREQAQMVNVTSPSIAGTAYATWQGVTAVESYRGNSKPETAISILYGERARNMGRAFEKALEISMR